MNELFLAFLSKTLNMDNEELSALLYEADAEGKPTDALKSDALDALLQKHAGHISNVGADAAKLKAEFDKGHKAGKAETLDKYEASIKSKFKLQSDKTGLSLIEELVSSAAKAASSEEVITAHPLYLSLQSSISERETALKNEYEDKIKAIGSEYEQRSAFSEKVAPFILERFNQLSPVLPSNATAAEAQRRMFLDQFKDAQYEADPSGKDFFIMRNGEVLKNEHGHPVKLSALAKQTAEGMFDLAAQPDRGNAGNNEGGAKPGAAGGGKYNFKDEADYAERYDKEPDIAKRVEMAKEWFAE